jgi:hypothetical protein
MMYRHFPFVKRTSAFAGFSTSRGESALRWNQNVIRSTDGGFLVAASNGLDVSRSGEPGINHLRIQKIAMLSFRRFETLRRFFALRFSGCERTLRCCETGF